MAFFMYSWISVEEQSFGWFWFWIILHGCLSLTCILEISSSRESAIDALAFGFLLSIF